MITTEAGRIAVSPSVPGTVRDLTIRRQGPPCQSIRAYADSGYEGYQNNRANIDISNKSSKAKDDRDYNHGLSSFRVRVEHPIRRIKKFCYHRASHVAKFAMVAGISNIIEGF